MVHARRRAERKSQARTQFVVAAAPCLPALDTIHNYQSRRRTDPALKSPSSGSLPSSRRRRLTQTDERLQSSAALLAARDERERAAALGEAAEERQVYLRAGRRNAARRMDSRRSASARECWSAQTRAASRGATRARSGDRVRRAHQLVERGAGRRRGVDGGSEGGSAAWGAAPQRDMLKASRFEEIGAARAAPPRRRRPTSAGRAGRLLRRPPPRVGTRRCPRSRRPRAAPRRPLPRRRTTTTTTISSRSSYWISNS